MSRFAVLLRAREIGYRWEMMPIEQMIVGEADLFCDLSGRDMPLAFVDLDAWTRDFRLASLPPFPLIGLGASDHPAAPMLDAVLESPITAESVARNVVRHPHAAQVAVQLLRAIADMPVALSLSIESLAYGLLQAGGEHRAWLAAYRPASVRLTPGTVHVTRDDAVLRVVIDRPDAGNAIDRAVRDALFEAFTVAAVDRSVARVELRSTGRLFSLGGDLEEFGTTTDPSVAHAIRARTLPAVPLSRCADRLFVHVQGGCVGAGIELAAFAREISAAPHAWFQLPELAMGVIPGAGGCVSISRRIGRQRAALMILSGRRIGARTALAWGLIDRIVDLPPVDPGGGDADLA